MTIFALGLNHQTAPLNVREKVVFHVERMGDALGEAKRLLAPEAAILSTCNRTELYLSGDLEDGKRAASFIWPRISGSPSTMESRPEATRKACRSACSRGNV